jgi:hypothetical protein
MVNQQANKVQVLLYKFIKQEKMIMKNIVFVDVVLLLLLLLINQSSVYFHHSMFRCIFLFLVRSINAYNELNLYLHFSCPYESGTYYVVLPNSGYKNFDLQISFQTYNTEATAIPIGSSSYTISASQTNQFQFFYYDQDVCFCIN